MDQLWLPLSLAVLGMLAAYMLVSRRHLLAYLERYRSMPERTWILRSDPDPVVERWRRLRLLVTGILLVLIALQVILFFS